MLLRTDILIFQFDSVRTPYVWVTLSDLFFMLRMVYQQQKCLKQEKKTVKMLKD
jgi:hypothetical protein